MKTDLCTDLVTVFLEVWVVVRSRLVGALSTAIVRSSLTANVVLYSTLVLIYIEYSTTKTLVPGYLAVGQTSCVLVESARKVRNKQREWLKPRNPWLKSMFEMVLCMNQERAKRVSKLVDIPRVIHMTRLIIDRISA